MPAGQPTKYNEAFCARVIEMGKEGCSKAEMAADLEISRESFNQYEKDYPQFFDAVKQAVYFSQAWWEAKGREATFNSDPEMTFNATSYIFNMKNRFREDWKDKIEQELTGKDGGAIKTETKVVGLSETNDLLVQFASSGSQGALPEPGEN